MSDDLLPDPVDDAAIWATAHWWTAGRPLLPLLVRKFKISDDEAMQAIRAAFDVITRRST
ncbi:hypothetical protein [Mesorhizobium carmichaelinearum]|uniref:hypothetical protein n=1 Tax=Mesorhizobium carmichaelinearum TaxID=1208188 RepID=UPI000BA3E13A|nr:hypothetical protein [Mesorhizobium carmichaelinearum]